MLLLWLTGIAALGLSAGITWYVAPLEPGVLTLQMAFTPRSFGEVIHFWSAGQLARYRVYLGADFALLLSYGSLGYLLGSRTKVFHTLSPALRRAATWALPLAAILDATENAFHLWLTEVPRFGLQLPYLLAASCATLKWLLILAYALTLVFALARAED